MLCLRFCTFEEREIVLAEKVRGVVCGLEG